MSSVSLAQGIAPSEATTTREAVQRFARCVPRGATLPPAEFELDNSQGWQSHTHCCARGRRHRRGTLTRFRARSPRHCHQGWRCGHRRRQAAPLPKREVQHHARVRCEAQRRQQRPLIASACMYMPDIVRASGFKEKSKSPSPRDTRAHQNSARETAIRVHSTCTSTDTLLESSGGGMPH